MTAMRSTLRPDPGIAMVVRAKNTVALKPELSQLVDFFVLVANSVGRARDKQVKGVIHQIQSPGILQVDGTSFYELIRVNPALNEIIPVEPIALNHAKTLPAKLLDRISQHLVQVFLRFGTAAQP